MSWAHIIAARSAPPDGLTPAARHVALVIATYTNDAGRTWVGIPTLAADTGYHPATVRRLIGQLEQSTTGCVIHRKGRTSLLNLAPWVARPRALRREPRALAAHVHTEQFMNTAARAGPGDNAGPVPTAWHRILDPGLRDEAIQLRLEMGD